MGGVLKAAPIEQAAVEHIRAGGDLCLICHIEEYVTRSYEALIKDSGARDRKFAKPSKGVGGACAGLQEKIRCVEAQAAGAHAASWKNFHARYGSSAKKCAWPG